MNNAGEHLAQGEGCTRSEEKAVKWFRQAAEAGSPRAQNHLRLLHMSGEGGLRRNTEQARTWLEKSTSFNLAELHVSQGETYQAMELFRQLAEAGNAAAQRRLGDILFQHGGVEEAPKWYLRGALQVDPTSMHNLVGCCLQPPQQSALSVHWMEKVGRHDRLLQSCEQQLKA
jgi:TPR repeat protein